MTRNMTAAGAAAFYAMLLVFTQLDASAQTNTAAKTPVKAAPAKTAPVKAAPAKAAPAKAAPSAPAAAKASLTPAAQVDLKDSITLTGCLETDGTRYRLADVQGHQTPMERSWKTAFITN